MSKILDYFGGPKALRQSFKTEIIEHLRDERPCNSDQFFAERSSPSNQTVRALRKQNKRREHIYNYERERAAHLWSEKIYLLIDRNSAPLLSYRNGDKVLTINTNHHPILVKVLQSLVLDSWEAVTLKLEALGNPNYRFPEPDPGIAPRSSNFGDVIVDDEWTPIQNQLNQAVTAQYESRIIRYFTTSDTTFYDEVTNND